MKYLKQSTATDVVIGAFVDDTDGKTAETALTIANTDVKIMKNGGASANKNDATSATHLVNGSYKIPLNATDTATLGRLDISINVSGALIVVDSYMVIPANVFDSMFSTDLLQVDVVQISGDSTSADNLEADYDGTGYTKANSTIGTCTANTDMRGTDSALLASGYTAPDNASITSILADTNELQTNQGDWATADVSSLATQVSVDTIDSIVDEILVDTGTSLPADIAGVSAPTEAEIYTYFTSLSREDSFKADVTAVTLNAVQGSYAPAKAGDAMDIISSPNSTGLNAIADAILKRDFSAVAGESARSMLNALRFLRNKWSVTGSTLTVTKEDDATSAWTASVSSDASAEPITGSDPA